MKWGEYTCLLTLDINSAFISACRTDILCFLEEFGIEHSLLGMIDDYLWNRSIILSEGEYYFNVDVPRDSVSAHTFG